MKPVNAWLLFGAALIVTILGGCKMITMPGHSFSGTLPLLTIEEREISQHLNGHVHALAEKIGERNLWHYEALTATATYIDTTFLDLGYTVNLQEFCVNGKTVTNIEVERSGATLPDEIVIVGAHYDSVIGSPGANDNATGVAAVLELARLLANTTFARTVRFVSFVNEEPPFFQTDDMGSAVYAHRSHSGNENIVAMLSIETIGYYLDVQGSQHYPVPFSLFYPRTGNFIAFVGNVASQDLVHRSVASFRSHTKFPSEGIAVPGWITGIGWSDHWAFWEQGYQALMITDTAPFRYSHYHTPEDTHDKIDYDRTARVVAGIARVVAELASAQDTCVDHCDW